MDGVKLVWTADDIAPYVNQYGYPSLDDPDEEALASETVRYEGDEIAVVLVVDRKTAKRVANEVDVEYEPLDVVTESEDAMADDAPVLHPQLGETPSVRSTGTSSTSGRSLPATLSEDSRRRTSSARYSRSTAGSG